MAIEPFIKCSDLAKSIEFYTDILDFVLVTAPDPNSDSFMSNYALIERDGSLIHLSSHSADGAYGAVMSIHSLIWFLSAVGRGPWTEIIDFFFYELTGIVKHVECNELRPRFTVPLRLEGFSKKELTPIFGTTNVLSLTSINKNFIFSKVVREATTSDESYVWH